MVQPKDIGWYKAHIYAVYKKPTSDLGIHTDWRWEDVRRYSMQKSHKKKAGIAIFTSDKIKNVIRDKEGPYLMINGSFQEDTTITNLYVPNIRASHYIRILINAIQEEINNNTIIVGDFNTPLTSMDRSFKQKNH